MYIPVDDSAVREGRAEVMKWTRVKSASRIEPPTFD
jgi:hypothetical protein